MKKFLLIITVVTMALSLFACGAPADTTAADTTAADTTDKGDTPNTTETTAPISGDGTGDVADGTVDEVGNGKHVVALLMDHERTTAYSDIWGTWSNSGKDIKHQPDKTTEDGLRDIASVYYPSIGLYDVTDPDYQEYMMQLCKMSYIDTLNYYISTASELNEGKWWGENLDSNVLPMLEKYGLNATARLEKPINSMANADDVEYIKQVFSDIINRFGDRILTIDGRPVLAQFTAEGVKAETFSDWKIEHNAKYGVTPFFMITENKSRFSDEWFEAVDGFFGWVELDDAALCQFNENVGDYRRYATVEQSIVNHDLYIARINEYIADGKITFYSESVCPHFDDIAVWGWGQTPRKIEGGDNGELYAYKWESAIKNNAQMVNIPTWDDWGEASTIEPTLEYGIDYLELTRKYAAEYKGIEANTASLELPGWIYKIRKTTDDAEILAAMDSASQLIAESRYDEAEALVRPYVDIVGIPATSKEYFDYPTSPTTPLIPEETDEGKTAEVSGNTEIWTPSADTYVQVTSTKNVDFGKEDKMRVKNAYATNLSRNAFVQFDTTAAAFEGVEKATLRLFCIWSSKKPDEIAGRDIKLYATVADWQEETFSWKLQPLIIEKVADVDTSSLMSYNWIEIDVTEYVKYNYGKKISFMLRNEGADTEENHLDFATKEAGSNIPELVITSGAAVEQKPVVEIKESTIKAIADTYVENTGSVDKGGDELVRLKKMDTVKRTRNAFFKFDTSAYKNSDVFTATLKLYCHYTSTKVDLIQTRYIILYATSADWSESSFTWDTQPEKLGKIIAYVDTSNFTPNSWIELDVTEYLKEHKGEVISIMFSNEGQDHEEAHIDFNSREKQGHEPQLIIVSD